MEISAVDGTLQPAVFRAAEAGGRPLVIVLHTWGADFLQSAFSLRDEALALDWNYIHPDFRGQNDHPDACCSALALDDIDRALLYALENTGANPDRIHLVGVSGGAYATMCAYMSSSLPIASYMAWNGISDLAAWRDESLALSNPSYAMDVENCVDAPPESFVSAAALRSPLHMNVEPELLAWKAQSQLLLFAGMDDGQLGSGSVPPTHSLFFYNRVVHARGGSKTPAIVAQDELDLFMADPDSFTPTGSVLGDRDVFLERALPDGSVAITVFDGGHEWLVPVIVEIVEAT